MEPKEDTFDFDFGEKSTRKSAVMAAVLAVVFFFFYQAELLFDLSSRSDAFGFGAKYVQRVGVLGVVGITLQSQQANLRTIAVCHHQLVAGGYLGNLLASDMYVVALVFRSHGFATT